MEKGIRIGRMEFFTLFVMARLFGSLTFVGEGSMPIDTSTALLGQLIAALMAYALFRFIIAAVDMAGVETPLQLFFLPGKAFGRFATAIAGGCSLLVAIQVVNGFERYFTSAVYPSAQGLYFILFFIASVIYFNHMGVDAMSRLSDVLFAGLIVVLLLLVSGLWQSVEWVEVISPFYEGPVALAASIGRSFVDWADLIVMAMVFAMVSGEAKKTARWVFVVALGVDELLSFLLITVLGSYSSRHLFPIHVLFSAAEIWIPTRVDFLFMVVFTASCLIKAALHLGFVSTCIRTVFPPGAARYSLAVPAAIAGLMPVAFGHSEVLAAGFLALMNSGAPMLVMTLLLPIAAVGIAKITGRQSL